MRVCEWLLLWCCFLQYLYDRYFDTLGNQCRKQYQCLNVNPNKLLTKTMWEWDIVWKCNYFNHITWRLMVYSLCKSPLKSMWENRKKMFVVVQKICQTKTQFSFQNVHFLLVIPLYVLYMKYSLIIAYVIYYILIFHW